MTGKALVVGVSVAALAAVAVGLAVLFPSSGVSGACGDGEGWIAYSQDEEDSPDTEIFVIRPDGSSVKQVTKIGQAKFGLDWSPDCTRIVFSSGTSSSSHIWLINVDGAGLIQLTRGLGRDTYPAWSPDGERIAFASDRTGRDELYVMNSDGSDTLRLTTNLGSTPIADWSPDGTQLVFSASSGNPDATLFLIDADGSNLREISTRTACCASWAPDGSTVAVGIWSKNAQEIHLIDSASGEVVAQVTSHNLELPENPQSMAEIIAVLDQEDAYPSWSGDGTRLVFSSIKHTELPPPDATGGDASIEFAYELFVVDADGSNRLQLTNDGGSKLSPKWSPQ